MPKYDKMIEGLGKMWQELEKHPVAEHQQIKDLLNMAIEKIKLIKQEPGDEKE